MLGKLYALQKHLKLPFDYSQYIPPSKEVDSMLQGEKLLNEPKGGVITNCVRTEVNSIIQEANGLPYRL